MRSLIKYLDCGNIYQKEQVFYFRVRKFQDIVNKIIPFFKNYPIVGLSCESTWFCIFLSSHRNYEKQSSFNPGRYKGNKKGSRSQQGWTKEVRSHVRNLSKRILILHWQFLRRTRPTDNLNTMNPGFFTGFSDAERCFTFSVLRNKELKLGWVIKFKFQINLHQKDRIILEEIIKSPPF